MSTTPVSVHPPRAGTSPRAVLWVLLFVYILNFLDRQILSILKIPIKAELGLSDTQLGLMGGIALPRSIRHLPSRSRAMPIAVGG